MDAKEQLIHDIIVLEERLTRHYKAAHQPMDEIRKLLKRQRDVIDAYHQSKPPSVEEIEKIMKNELSIYHKHDIENGEILINVTGYYEAATAIKKLMEGGER